MNRFRISVIVVNWNGVKYISACLDSLLALDTKPHNLNIIVVDNNSTDSSVQLVSKKYPACKLIRNPTNMGFAAGNNTGIRFALDQGSDFIWIVNPDITVAPDALQKFVAGTINFPHAGIFGGKIYFTPGYEFHKDRYKPADLGKVFWFAGGLIDWKNVLASHRGVDEVDHGQLDRDLETDFVTGACMFIRRQVLDEVGLFDAKYFLYFEENDLCQRVKQAGYSLYFLSEPKSWHANAQATGIGSTLQDYFLTRNRLLFGLRYASFYTKFALLREAINLLKSGRPWQKTGILDCLKGNFGLGSYKS